MSSERNEAAIAEQESLQKEALHWQSIEKEKQRRHELDLKKMDIEGTVKVKELEAKAANARLKATTRTDVVRRVLTALIKLPVLPLAVIFSFIVEMAKHDPIEALENFIDL